MRSRRMAIQLVEDNGGARTTKGRLGDVALLMELGAQRGRGDAEGGRGNEGGGVMKE